MFIGSSDFGVLVSFHTEGKVLSLTSPSARAVLLSQFLYQDPLVDING